MRAESLRSKTQQSITLVNSGADRGPRLPQQFGWFSQVPCWGAVFVISLMAGHARGQGPQWPRVPAAPQQIAPIAPAPAPLSPPTADVLRDFAREHGFVVVLGESFANHWVFTERCDEGPYHDVVMEAVVDGNQSTKSRTTLDITPWPSSARMLLRLDGVTNNRSVAKTPQAALETVGTYQFHLTKQVEFDGRVVRTWSPSAFLQIDQRHLGAATPMSMVPLLGPLANNVALSVAQQRKPMAEQIAAVRVTGCVAPEFNDRVDKELAGLNQRLESDVRGKLDAIQLSPRRVAARSTDDAILFGASYRDAVSTLPVVQLGERSSLTGEMARVRLAQSLPTLPPLLAPPGGGQFDPLPVSPAPTWGELPLGQLGMVALHESIVGDFARLSPLAGLRISDAQLNSLLAPAEVLPNSSDEGLADLIFSTQSPAAGTFQDGEMLFTLRIVFQPRIGPALPEQELTIAIRPVLEPTLVRFQSELRSLRAVNGWGDETMRMVAEPILRAAIAQRLQERTVPREFDIPRENGHPPIPARIHSLTVRDGWLSIAVEARALPVTELRPQRDVQAG